MALKPLYQVQNLSFGYQGQSLLCNLNFEIYPQDRIAIIGPSGSGKSTLLKLLAGLITPSNGQVLFEGHHLATTSEDQLVKLRRKMGLLFQKNALFDSMTSFENIAFSLREASITNNTSTLSSEVTKGLESVGLGHATHLFPDEMSGGMQKRLGIARAQALKPEVLLYDDPTAGLDPITSRHIIELILTLQKECASTIVVVTNEIARALQVATRIFFVVHKECLDLGSPMQAKQSSDARVQQFLKAQSQGPLQGAL